MFNRARSTDLLDKFLSNVSSKTETSGMMCTGWVNGVSNCQFKVLMMKYNTVCFCCCQKQRKEKTVFTSAFNDSILIAAIWLTIFPYIIYCKKVDNMSCSFTFNVWFLPPPKYHGSALPSLYLRYMRSRWLYMHFVLRNNASWASANS